MLALIWHPFNYNRVSMSEVICQHTFAQHIPVQYVFWERCVNMPHSDGSRRIWRREAN